MAIQSARKKLIGTYGVDNWKAYIECKFQEKWLKRIFQGLKLRMIIHKECTRTSNPKISLHWADFNTLSSIF